MYLYLGGTRGSLEMLRIVGQFKVTMGLIKLGIISI